MLRTFVLILSIIFSVGCSSCTTDGTPGTGYKYVKTQQDALKSAVFVEFGSVTGSGFVINTFLSDKGDERCYRILTAAHVLKPEHYDPRFPEPFVTFTLEDDTKMFAAKVTYKSVASDTALLTVWTYETEQLCLPFKIVGNDEYLKYTTDVYMVAFPQGFGPMLTEGIISGVSILDWDRAAFTTTAQSAPGSSGGPVIKSDTGEVVGFLKAVVTAPGSPHMFGWQSIVGPASDIRGLANWTEGSPIIVPAGPRGQDASSGILVFRPKQ